MPRQKETYAIEVHYPETEEDIMDLKKKMGAAYIQYVKDCILNLPVSDTDKNKIYEKTCEYLISYTKDKQSP